MLFTIVRHAHEKPEIMIMKQISVDFLPILVFVLFMVIAIFSRDKNERLHRSGHNA